MIRRTVERDDREAYGSDGQLGFKRQRFEPFDAAWNANRRQEEVAVCAKKLDELLNAFTDSPSFSTATPEAERLHFEPSILAQRGSALFLRFAERMNKCHNADFEIAFHGTHPQNVASILQQGMDPKRRGTRNGQSYGEGFYFSRSTCLAATYSLTRRPAIWPLPAPGSVAEGVDTDNSTFKVIVFALLPGTYTVHQGNTIMVVQDERTALPLGVLTVPCALVMQTAHVSRAQPFFPPSLRPWSLSSGLATSTFATITSASPLSNKLAVFEAAEPITASLLAKAHAEARDAAAAEVPAGAGAQQRPEVPARAAYASPEELAARMADDLLKAEVGSYLDALVGQLVSAEEEREAEACAAVMRKINQNHIEDAAEIYVEQLSQAPGGAAPPWAAAVANKLLSLAEPPFEMSLMAPMFPGAFEALRVVSAAVFPAPGSE